MKIAAVVSAGILCACVPANAAVARSNWRAQAIRIVNQERAAEGLSRLLENRQLDRMAGRHSAMEMRTQRLTHRALEMRATASGYDWRDIGENTGVIVGEMNYRGMRLLVSAFSWKKYPDHRANVMSTKWHDIGIGIVRDPGHNRIWLTEEFGRSF